MSKKQRIKGHKTEVSDNSDNPIAAYLPVLKSHLIERHYAPNTIRLLFSATKAFVGWFGESHYTIGDLDEVTIDRYIETLRQNKSADNAIRKAISALPHLLMALREQGVIAQQILEPTTNCNYWLDQFDRYLSQVVGLAEATRRKYATYVSRFLRYYCGNEPPDWSLLIAKDITSFVQQETSRLSRNSRSGPIVAVRAMLRYLIFLGEIPKGMLAAVPKTRKWKHDALPKYLSEDEVELLISKTLERFQSGLRNQAILLLLARLGLRANEVCLLQLDDIDWVESNVLIRANKSRRERRLPLPNDVGVAIFTYLKHERPKNPSRFIFLRSKAPFTPFCDSSAISKIVRRTMTYVGLENMSAAAHLLRHSAATRMVCKGATFKDVADVLGHQSLQTTAIYAKLDLESLSNIALPWPGGV